MASAATLCDTATEGRVASDVAFSSWRDATENSLNTLGAVTQTLTPDQEKLLLATQNDIATTMVCLQKKMNALQTTSTSISQAEEAILGVKKQLQEEHQNVQIAKDRLDYMRNKASDVSFYESWFPVERPLKQITVPILMGLSIFMTLMAVGYILSFIGIELLVRTTWAEYQYPPWAQAILGQFTLSFWVLLAILMGVVYYFTSRVPAATDSLPAK